MLRIILPIATLLAASACFGEVLTFDTLPDTGTFLCTGGIVPNGYGGLNWNNFAYLNSAASSCSVSGYGTALASSPNVGFNDFGTPASITSPTPFTLVSADFAAAWDDGLAGYDYG